MSAPPRMTRQVLSGEHLECARLLIETFRPRMDVYAFRFDTQQQCDGINRWMVNKAIAAGDNPKRCHLQTIGGWKPQGPKKNRTPITVEAIARHVAGFETLGFYPLHPDGTCNSVSVDFDNHRGAVTTERDPREDFDAVCAVLMRRGVRFLGNVSRGGRGYWIHVLTPRGTLARDARAVLDGVIRESGVKHITEGGTFDALCPKQDELRNADGSPAETPGNLFCLPISMRWMSAETPGTYFIGTDSRSLNEQITYLKEL